MRKIFGCLIFFMIIMTSQILAGTVYYVDATNGNDSNEGLSPATAWQTISKVNRSSFSPGDYILLKRGEIWREQLVVPSSGNDGNSITFGAYGNGVRPIINGADILTTWTYIGGNIYLRGDIRNEPSLVFYNGSVLTENNGATTSVGSNEWDWDSNTLYVNVGEDPDTGTLEANQRTYCVYGNSTDYITIQNLDIQKANQTAISNVYGDYWVVDSNTVKYSGDHGSDGGIRSSGDAGNKALAPIIKNNTVTANINNSIFIGWGDGAEVYNNNSYDNDYHQYTGIADGSAVDNHIFFQSCSGTGSASFHCYNNTCTNTVRKVGIICSLGSGGLIENNTVTGCKQGISASQDNCIVRYNKTENTTGAAGYKNGNGATNCQFYYNISINDYTGFYTSNTTSMEIYNNTIYSDSKYRAMHITTNSAGTIKNNIIYATNYTANVLFVYDIGTIILDYNCIYPEGTGFIYYDGTSYDTLAAYQVAERQDANSLKYDPLFVDASNNDFILQVGSPCINAGIDVELTQDYAGNIVPYGWEVDIGAYEYQGSTNPPNANINASSTSGYVPLTVDFTANASGGTSPYSYSWDFGDGNSSSEQDPTHTYSNAGTYSVIFTVTDSNSNKASDALTITVSATPTFNLTLSSATGSPAPGSGGTTDPSPGNHSYSSGSSVQIKATPNTNYRFSKWSGDVSTSETYNEEITITMNKDKSISSYFCTKCGDVNGNLSITPADAQAAFDIFLGRIANPTEYEKENADVNCSGTKTTPNTTPADAQAIFEKFLGKNELPCDCSCNSRTASVLTQTKQTSNVNLIINDIQVNLGEEVFVPIIVDNPFNMKAFGFDLFFPSDILEFVGVEGTELLKDFEQVDANKIAEGALRVGGYGSTPIIDRSPRVLISLVFRVIGEAKEPTSFAIINTVDDVENASCMIGLIINTVDDAKNASCMSRLLNK